MSAADALREEGFREVADLLEAALPRAAWNALRRFHPCSFAEAQSLDRARRVMPELESEDE